MMWKLLLLFTVLPAIEIGLLVGIGTQIGPWWTTLIVLLTGLVGAWLAKREGVGVLRRLRTDLQRGLPPSGRIAEAVLVLCGGLLLVTPGIITDITGFLLIIPFSRRWIAPPVTRAVVRWFTGDKELADSIDLNFGEGAPDGPADNTADAPEVVFDREATRPHHDPHFDHPVR